MTEHGKDRDARWMGALALAVVGIAAVLIVSAMPPEGIDLFGMRIEVQLPSAFSKLMGTHAEDGEQDSWSPEDVAALLAGYDSDWEEATSNGQDLPGEHPAEQIPDSAVSAAREDTGGVQDVLVMAPAVPNGDTTSVIGPAPSGPHRKEGFLPSPKRPIAVAPDAQALPSALMMSIPTEARPAFGRLFSGLDEHGQVEVLHYGDSQIEGDRISGVMRNAWQRRWGGHGPGLQAAVPLVQSFAVEQSHEGAWERHTRYGRRDTTDRDERYGLLACYASISDSASGFNCLTIAPENRNHVQFGRWNGLRLWHDSVGMTCPLLLDGHPVDTLTAGAPPSAITLFPSPMDTVHRTFAPSELCFSGIPPRIFAIEPIGEGVQWHGIPMRGSSGTLFRRLERPLFTRQLRTVAPHLVILQFGGNMVPYCKDQADADRYAGWFSSQIRLFHQVLPEAAILVIGPSDMSEKRGLEWTTYPFLTDIRDALKKAAMEEGAAFWDLFDVMGGAGSMPAWVASAPPLAGPDHVHFTPHGAKQVGTLLDRSFLAAYGEWKQHWAKPAPDTLHQQAARPLPATSQARPQLQLHGPG